MADPDPPPSYKTSSQASRQANSNLAYQEDHNSPTNLDQLSKLSSSQVTLTLNGSIGQDFTRNNSENVNPDEFHDQSYRASAKEVRISEIQHPSNTERLDPATEQHHHHDNAYQHEINKHKRNLSYSASSHHPPRRTHSRRNSTYKQKKSVQRHASILSKDKRIIVPQKLETLPEFNDNLDLKYQSDITNNYCSNEIHTTKYTILSFLPKNLFEQFHRLANIYFVAVALLNFVPSVEAVTPALSLIPVIIILSVTAIKDIIEDYRRYLNDKELNAKPCSVFNRKTQKYEPSTWKHIKVGDIIFLETNDIIPADLLILNSSDPKGVCYIETAEIDGESNLKQRLTPMNLLKSNYVKQQQAKKKEEQQQDSKTRSTNIQSLKRSNDACAYNEYNYTLICMKPEPSIDKFEGTIHTIDDDHLLPNGDLEMGVNQKNFLLRGCKIRNTDFIEALVVYTGHDTKAMLNNNGPRMKRSKLERRMNKDVLYCFFILLLVCSFAAIANNVTVNWFNNFAISRYLDISLYYPPTSPGPGNTYYYQGAGSSGFTAFWRMIVLLQILIPISLYVSLEIVKAMQIYLIHQDLKMYDADTDEQIKCRAMNITEDLGQIEYVFSDKTGTLTENIMVFRRCVIHGQDYPHGNEDHSHLQKAHRKNVFSANPRRKKSSLRAHHRREMSAASRKSLGNIVVRPSQIEKTDSIKKVRKESKKSADMQSILGNDAINMQRRRRSNTSSQERRDTISSIDSEIDADQQIDPDHALEQRLSEIDPEIVKSLLHDSDDTHELRCLEFFTCLAVCNTVVMSEKNLIEINKQKQQLEEKHKLEKLNQKKNKANKLTKKARATMNSILSYRKTKPSLKQEDTSNKLEEVKENKPISALPIHMQQFSTNLEQKNVSQNSIEDNSIDSDVENIQPVKIKVADMIKNNKISYEAESPDESALVTASQCYKYHLLQRSPTTISIGVPQYEYPLVFEILHTFEFSSDRKRMSMIVRHPISGKIVLYTKGADNVILDLLKKPVNVENEENIPETIVNTTKLVNETKEALDSYARKGLRTLCIARKVIPEEEYQAWLVSHKAATAALTHRERKIEKSMKLMETDLQLLGATGIEDKLQKDVTQTIKALKGAGIQVWVITGDKVETAINIGYSCELLKADEKRIDLVGFEDGDKRPGDKERLKIKIQRNLDRLAKGQSLNTVDHLDAYSQPEKENLHENSKQPTRLRNTKSVCYDKDSKVLQDLRAYNSSNDELKERTKTRNRAHRRNQTVTFVNIDNNSFRSKDKVEAETKIKTEADESEHQMNQMPTLNEEEKIPVANQIYNTIYDKFFTSVSSKEKEIEGGYKIQPETSESYWSRLVSALFGGQNQSQDFSKTKNSVGLVIDGKTLKVAISHKNPELQTDFLRLTQYCRTVLVCRASPKQKGEVVQLVKTKLKVQTLAIGDGANDVNMIQKADIGVGISGLEGMQAVMNSDFAISKFRFLKRLLLVHGHWSYYRLSSMVLYFFYKNVSFVLIPFWYQFLSGFGGANPVDDMILLTFNLLFNSVPPLVQGVLDQDVSANTLELGKNYNLYQQGVRSEVYLPRTFWLYWMLGCYQSLVCFWVPYLYFIGSDLGYLSLGWITSTSIILSNLLSLAVEFKNMTWIHIASEVGSFVLFILFSWGYTSIKLLIPIIVPSSFGMFQNLFSQGSFWLTVLLSVCLSVLPHLLCRTIQFNLFPNDVEKERVQERERSQTVPKSGWYNKLLAPFRSCCRPPP